MWTAPTPFSPCCSLLPCAKRQACTSSVGGPRHWASLWLLGHQLGLSIEKLWAGGLGPPALCLGQVGEDGHGHGAPAHRCWWEWPGAKVWPAWAPFLPQAQGPGPGVAGETPLQAMLAGVGRRQGSPPFPCPLLGLHQPPVPFLSLRTAGVVSPCRPCLPQVGTAVCLYQLGTLGLPSLSSHAQARPAGPVRSVVEKISVHPSLVLPRPWSCK